MKFWKAIVAATMLAGWAGVLVGCESQEEQEQNELAAKAVGTWRLDYNWNDSGEANIPTMTLTADGRFTDGTYSGNWFVEGEHVFIVYPGAIYEGYLTTVGTIVGSMKNSSTGETGTFTMTRIG